MNKKAFSFVEIIISVSIIIILGIVATTTSNNLKNNSNNAKVIADLNTISNALISYKNENGKLPIPGGNNNNFTNSGSYSHSFTGSETFGVYGKFTQDTLPKKYIDITPIDPRSNSYYSYGITKNTSEYELAGVIGKKDNYIAKVIGNYKAENGIYSLIREYNGANFVVDNDANLPYNPEEKILIATTADGTIYKKGDIITNNSGSDLEIFFSDGSTSIITDGSILELKELNFPKENNLVSTVKLYLQAGSIWTNATRLGTESSFEISTNDTTAAVRGTIFKVEKNIPMGTKVSVIEGSVEVTNMSSSLLINVENGDDVKTINIISNTAPFSIGNIINVNFNTLIQPFFLLPNTTINNIETSVNESIKNNIYQKVLDDENNKSCFLEGTEVKNGHKISSYKEKYVSFGFSCSAPIFRTCTDSVLNGDNNYKYNSCDVKGPNQCSPYTDDGFIGGAVTDEYNGTFVTKTESVELGGFTVGINTITRYLTCNAGGLGYSIDGTYPNVICDNYNHFIADGFNSCKCDNGYDFYNDDGKCYENPFGPDYSLVKVVPTIIGPDFWLNGLGLGNNFGLVFDTNGVSQNAAESIYLHDVDGNKNIVYSKFKKLKLSTNGEDPAIPPPYNIIKYSNTISPSISKTLKIKFDGTTWDDISSIITNNIGTYGTPIILNSNNLKITNSNNIRVFKKNIYAGYGCGACPGGYYELAGNRDGENCPFSGDKDEKYCINVKNLGLDVICSREKSATIGCSGRDDWGWSGIYNP